MRKISPPKLTPEQIASIFTYEPTTGILRWKTKVGKRVVVGMTAGSFDGRYIKVNYNGTRFLAHRIAWVLFYGSWPTLELDHINNNKTDNRIVNLRQATPSNNLANKKVNSHSLTGVKGVTRDKRDGRYYAYIDIDGRRQSLGGFKTAEAANSVRIEAEKKIRKEFFFHR